MARALVVYESMFGNTRTIAEAIADGLRTGATVDVAEAATAPATIPADVALLVVGGPTHALGLSRPNTRADATKQAGGHVVSTGEGIREWLATVTAEPTTGAATFATRIRRPRVPGSAARAAARRLRARGLRLVAPPTDFWVAGTPGPLHDGEVDRARRWGATLASELAVRSPG